MLSSDTSALMYPIIREAVAIFLSDKQYKQNRKNPEK
jgi:hypothetical protein